LQKCICVENKFICLTLNHYEYIPASVRLSKCLGNENLCLWLIGWYKSYYVNLFPLLVFILSLKGCLSLCFTSWYRQAMGLHQAIARCMENCHSAGLPGDNDWYKTVVLSGGTACLPGLAGNCLNVLFYL